MNLVNLQTLISQGDYTLNIPIYQRPYVWDKQQLNDILEDLNTLKLDDGQDSHFLGLFVYTKHDETSTINLIDGQQRITTIFILINVIIDFLNKISIQNPSLAIKHKLPQEVMKLSGLVYREQDSIYKRKLKSLNEENYEDLFLCELVRPVEEDTVPNYEEYKNDPVRFRYNELTKIKATKRIHHRTFTFKRSLKAHLFFREEFLNKESNSTSEEFIQFLKGLSKKLQDRVRIIDFKAGSDAEAFRLFEVLNDRGISVSPVDLLKNICLTNGINQVQVTDIHEKWSDVMQKTLADSTDYIFFLRSSHNSRFPFARKAELYQEFKARYQDITYVETINKLQSELLIDAVHFMTARGLTKSKAEAIDRLISILVISKTKQYVPLVISLLRVMDICSKPGTQALIIKCLEKIVEITVCMMINDIRFNKIEEAFPSIAVQVKSYTTCEESEDVLNNCLESLTQLQSDKMKYANLSFNDIDDGSETGNNTPYKLILLLLYYHNDISFDSELKELEHVLPQKIADSYWVDRFEVDDKRFIYSIGNMLLLNKKLNASVGNKDFLEKAKTYKTFKVQDVVDSSSLKYNSCSDWNKGFILKREEYLLNQIEQTLGFKTK